MQLSKGLKVSGSRDFLFTFSITKECSVVIFVAGIRNLHDRAVSGASVSLAGYWLRSKNFM